MQQYYNETLTNQIYYYNARSRFKKVTDTKALGTTSINITIILIFIIINITDAQCPQRT